MQSALTGHFVLSSLHATDATAALHRFIDMGIEPFLVASSVVGVVAQRLVRRICSRVPGAVRAECRRARAATEHWGGAPKDAFWHGAGCNFCAHTGYADRVGVYELLQRHRGDPRAHREAGAQDELRTRRDVRRACGRCGTRRCAWSKQDVTTVAEVLRTIYVA